MPEWSFLTSQARVLLCIAHDPGLRLRDIAVRLGSTERTAHGVLTDLVQAGYVTKTKDGRGNRYQIQAHLPLPEPGTREPPGRGAPLLTLNRSSAARTRRGWSSRRRAGAR